MTKYHVTVCIDCGEICSHYPVNNTSLTDYQSKLPLTNIEIKQAIQNGQMTGSLTDDCHNCLPKQFIQLIHNTEVTQ